MSPRKTKTIPPPRAPLRRERILQTAIEIADARGVNAVTMRAVAARLGVEAMSLYNHVHNKDEILDGMVDLVVEEIRLPEDIADWRAAMRQRAISVREVFGRHPWVATLIDSRTSSGPARLRYLDWVLGVLVRAGFTLESAIRSFSLLDSYIYGFGRQEINASSGGAPAEDQAAAILSVIPIEKYPYLHRMAAMATESGYDAAADFDFGLDIILDGLERIRGESRSS